MTQSGQHQPLPAEIRQQLVVIAADLIGRRPVAELPASVRRFARFAPAKRLRLGAAEIAAALAADDDFRATVADVVRDSAPELAEQVLAGSPPSTADPIDVAVISYLLRPAGWTEVLAAITGRLAEEGQRRSADADVGRLRAELVRLGETNQALIRDRELARLALKTATAEHAAQAEELRRRIRDLQAELKTVQRTADQATVQLDRWRAERDRSAATDSVELRRARARIASLESGLEVDRRAARSDREHDDARLWLLLETIGAAAAGLRRELDVSEPTVRPADSVQAADTSAGRRPSTADGALLERLLDGGHVHLIVDGYNLTKTGYGSLPLADQRARLVSSLGALAARTGVEVTVAFDGTTAPSGAAATMPSPRGVRVLFSAAGQLADDLIRDLLQVEPAGRTVVVASSDQAVAASARGAGAWSTSAAILLSRVERG